MDLYYLLRNTFADHIVAENSAYPIAKFAEVSPLTRQEDLGEERLLVTTAGETLQILGGLQDGGTACSAFLLVAEAEGYSEQLKKMMKKAGVTGLAADLPAAEMSFRTLQAAGSYAAHAEEVRDLDLAKNIVQYAERMGVLLKCPILALSYNGRTLAGTYDFPQEAWEKIKDHWQQIVDSPKKTNFSTEGSIPDYYYWKAERDHFVYGFLFIIPDRSRAIDYSWPVEASREALISVLLPNSENPQGNTQRFSVIWNRIMQGGYASEEGIINDLAHSGFSTDDYCRLLVWQFCNPAADVEALYPRVYVRLKQIFPKALITLYEKRIVILNWEGERDLTYLIRDKDQKLAGLLEEYDSRLSVGWSSASMHSLRLLFRLHLRIHRLYPDWKTDENSRIISFGRESPKLTIDLGYQLMIRELNEEGLGLLMHPAVVALHRYDHANGTNLEEVLFQYTVNRHSVEKAAEALYMHRNTVTNKIAKIRKLTEIDLDDPYTQVNIVFSHYILNYSVRVAGKPIFGT